MIDATCGNGYDSLFLAQLKPAKLYLIDLQEKALEQTRLKLEDSSLLAKATDKIFIQNCHASFPPFILPSSIKLIVYNLGYLPGGDKTITTLVSTTLASLKQALVLLIKGGLISVTCYPGHLEGALEEQLLLPFVQQLDPNQWECCHHRWINRLKAPSLLILKKLI